MALTHALSTNNYGPAHLIVSASAANGTHTTIAGALTDAVSGDTIFIRDGSYTEDLTLKAGVNLTSWSNSGDSPTSQVTIIGKSTMTLDGTCQISNMRLQTNSDFFLAVTGNVNSNIRLTNCYLNCTNNTGISYTSSGASSGVNLTNCKGDLGTTGIALFASSGSGVFQGINSSCGNSGSSTTANTVSAGTLSLTQCILLNPVTTSSTAILNLKYTNIDAAATNTTALTHGGSGTSSATLCIFSSGSASAISISATLLVDICRVDSSNTNAITGAGTIKYGLISFTGSSSTINTSTKTPIALPVFQGGTGQTTLTNHGVLVGAATSGITQLSVGATGTVLQGSTGADPAFTATPTLTSVTFGAGTALSNYVEGTFNPTIDGSVSGMTTYSSQNGYYIRVGNLVWVYGRFIITGATGTGQAILGSLPFTVRNQTNGSPIGSFQINSTTWTWPASTTYPFGSPILNTTTANILCEGSGVAAAFLSMNNSAASFAYAFMYEI